MYTLFDLKQGSPESIIVTEGIVHDKEKMGAFVTTPGITYIFDRGYLEYKEFDGAAWRVSSLSPDSRGIL